ncbi:MAG: thiosulfate oxidation carrier complex protein SoxZ [Magnetospirillum sp.]|nr:thiosulfate oxidation carrier complex protein SoxZ [Magnetospirillum sp.]
MANSDRVKVRIPAKAKKGEIIEIKTQISHDMETGQRKDAAGKTIPRHIITRFTCTWNNEPVISADWHQAVSANPFSSFFALASASGKIKLSWFDENGEVFEYVHDITVE